VSVSDLIILIGVGLVAGLLGGMLGIGGSIVIIPVLTVVVGKNQHLSQASAMIVNVLVSLPAVLRHQRAGAVRWDIMLRMLPGAAFFIVVGVFLSNHIARLDDLESEGTLLERFFGIFLLYVIVMNVHRLGKRGDVEPSPEDVRRGWLASTFVGSIMGFSAGLLGVGGGIICVPLLQRVVRLPLRQSIATSAALICLTSAVGAIGKNATLEELVDAAGVPLNLQLSDSLLIAACLAPTAVIGGLLGAGLTHRLPLKWVRIVFIMLLTVAALKMLDLI
jgi:hypothetical protein